MNGVSDMDRFTEFLRREAKGYNEAPDVPVEVMWRGVEGGLGEGVAGPGPVAASESPADGEAVDALGYNEAPRAPREEMWGRIEAAWGMGGVGGVGPEGQGRIGAGAGGVVAGWTAGWREPWRSSSRRMPRGRRVAGWAAGLAAAASLVLGLALGRNVGPSPPGEVVGGPQAPAPVTGPGEEPPGATIPTASVDPAPSPANLAQSAEPVQSTDPEPEILVAGVLPIPVAAVDPQAARVPGDGLPAGVPVADATPVARTTVFPSPFTARRDHETVRYLGRAETLLTAFRIDQRTPASEVDLAMWARELLIETRMRLDLPVSRTPEENALLEDLELILLQISRLGTGLPHVEWQLARESMELKGTLPRLRAVSSTDGL